MASQIDSKQLEAFADEAAEAARARTTLDEAAKWYRDMSRAFKGVRGAPTRSQRVAFVLKKFGLAEPAKND